MKRKIYSFATSASTNHDVNILKKIDNDGGIYTPEEHAYAMKKNFNDTIFKSKKSLIRHYLPDKFKKTQAVQIVLDTMSENNYKGLISMGAGEAVLEYFISMCLPEDATVIACDFDPFLTEKTNEFFSPDVKAVQFDFFNDDVKKIYNESKAPLDLAVFFSSAYVMDDDEFINLLSSMKQSGFKKIIDFHAGYMDFPHYLMNMFRVPTKNTALRKVFGKKPIIHGGYKGKFHGYSRTKGELRRLYKASGYTISKETSAGVYKYIAELSI